MAIVDLFTKSRETYGYRRMKLALRNETGACLSGKTVRKIMREESLTVKTHRKKKFSTFKGSPGIVDDLVKRNFSPTSPRTLFTTDITQIKLRDTKLYLSPLIDLFNREVVSWAISPSPNMDLVMRMLDDAESELRYSDNPVVIHTDQGFHYWNIKYSTHLDKLNIVRSMSGKGNCLDNACVESFFSRLKDEFIYRYTFKTISELVEGLEEYINWYNTERIKEALDGLSPLDYLTRYEQEALAS